MSFIYDLIAWVKDDPYITLFIITFAIGLLKASHAVMQQGFVKSAMEAILVSAMVTIACKAANLADGEDKYDALVLMGSGIAYLGFKHTEIFVRSMLKIMFLPLDKMFGTRLSEIIDEDLTRKIEKMRKKDAEESDDEDKDKDLPDKK